jgi:hypothetical protein
MTKGTALFDAVPISGTLAWVRAASRECVFCEHGGGVVRMLDGDIKFKGGTISNTTAVRERLSRSHVLCRMLMLHANVAHDALPRNDIYPRHACKHTTSRPCACLDAWCS